MAFNCNIMDESTELSFLGGCVLYVQTRLWTLGVLYASCFIRLQVTAPALSHTPAPVGYLLRSIDYGSSVPVSKSPSFPEISTFSSMS
jgi:hypothetical protein